MNLMKANQFPEYDTPTKRAKTVVVFGGGNVGRNYAKPEGEKCAHACGGKTQHRKREDLSNMARLAAITLRRRS